MKSNKILRETCYILNNEMTRELIRKDISWIKLNIKSDLHFLYTYITVSFTYF